MTRLSRSCRDSSAAARCRRAGRALALARNGSFSPILEIARDPLTRRHRGGGSAPWSCSVRVALCRGDDAGRYREVRESNPPALPTRHQEPLSRHATSGQLPPWRSPPPLRLPTRATADLEPIPPSSLPLGSLRRARVARARGNRRACARRPRRRCALGGSQSGCNAPVAAPSRRRLP